MLCWLDIRGRGMSDETKRFVIGATIVLTWVLFGTQPEEPWWVVVGFMLLIMTALHAVLGVPIVWIEGFGAWDKTPAKRT